MKHLYTLLLLLLPIMASNAQPNIYTIQNTTNATLAVTLKPAYLFSSDVDLVIKPGKTEKFKVSRKCIGSIVVRGLSEPLALVKASFLMPEDPGTIFMTDLERNHCSSLQLVIEHRDYKYVDPYNIGDLLNTPIRKMLFIPIPENYTSNG